MTRRGDVGCYCGPARTGSASPRRSARRVEEADEIAAILEAAIVESWRRTLELDVKCERRREERRALTPHQK